MKKLNWKRLTKLTGPEFLRAVEAILKGEVEYDYISKRYQGQ